MKVGVLTFHDTTNFGSLLQTYGLYKAIDNLGVDCEVIDYQCKSIVERELPKPIEFSFNMRSMARQALVHYFDSRKYRGLLQFSKDRLKLSPRYDRENIGACAYCYDRFMVGSDIVWGLDITQGDTAYFLDFVKDKHRKFAFSSSIGNQWSDTEKSLVAPLLSDFNYIAVREEESAEWVEEVTGHRPDVVCDPTMLLTSQEWSALKSERYKGKKYIFVYFNDSLGRCLQMAKQYADRHNLEVLYVNYGLPIKGITSVHPYTIADFLSLIYYADRCFTASYHGMLFSLYFNKQFVYFNRAHKSRMNTLASKLSVQNCNGESVDIDHLPNVDYNQVNTLVEQYRMLSLEKLTQLVTL